MSRSTVRNDPTSDYRRLFMLRGIIFGGEAVTIVLAGWWLHTLPSWQVLIGLWAVCTMLNALSLHSLTVRDPVAPFALQLLVDLLALAVLLYWTGGATNPFVWLLVFPPTIAAITLPRGHVWLVTITACLLYTLLLRFFLPIPGMNMPSEPEFSLHIVGMWAGFIVSVVLIAHFLSHMAKNVRERDLELAGMREQALRDEKLVSLGALATNAAHDLGTPLGTLALLTEELDADIGTRNAYAARDKLALMDTQITRCKQAIATVVTSAGIDAAQGGQAIALSTFVNTTVEDWTKRRSDACVTFNVADNTVDPRIVADRNLVSALTNIFDNAADASPAKVGIQASWNSESLDIRVLDRGDGFAPGKRSRIGKMPFSDKPRGHGLGLYLSHGIIARLGGTLAIRPRIAGGTSVNVQLPLAALKP